MNGQKTNIVSLFIEDHQKMRELFQNFKSEPNEIKKQSISDSVLQELELHSSVETEIFYPALQKAWANTPDYQVIAEAIAENDTIKTLIAELRKMQAGDGGFDAKFKVLMDNSMRHFQKDETEIFTKIGLHTNLDAEKLCDEVERRKKELRPKQTANIHEARMDGEGGANYAEVKDKEKLSAIRRKS